MWGVREKAGEHAGAQFRRRFPGEVQALRNVVCVDEGFDNAHGSETRGIRGPEAVVCADVG